MMLPIDGTNQRGEVSPAATPEADAFHPELACVLAEKILRAWLRNRYQLLFPFAFDPRRLDRRQVELLIHVMVNAAQADGVFEKKERERIEAALSLVDPDDEQRSMLAAALECPAPLNALLRDVADVQTGALVYAGSLLAIDQRKPVNRRYLSYLAARLELSDELVASLEQRFRSPG